MKLYGYMTDSERSKLAESMKMKNNFNKLIVAYEMCDSKLELDINDAECSVVLESGEEEDYSELVKTAVDEANSVKESIFRKMAGCICKLCANVLEDVEELSESHNSGARISKVMIEKSSIIKKSKGSVLKLLTSLNKGTVGTACAIATVTTMISILKSENDETFVTMDKDKFDEVLGDCKDVLSAISDVVSDIDITICSDGSCSDDEDRKTIFILLDEFIHSIKSFVDDLDAASIENEDEGHDQSDDDDFYEESFSDDDDYREFKEIFDEYADDTEDFDDDLDF